MPGEVGGLSDREREVLFLAADGLTDKEIAVRLEIGTKTVRTYWDRMRAKLNASSRTQCLALALKSAFDELQKSEERLRLFVQNMPVLFNAFDDRMNVISANDECERVSGYTVGELLGDSGIFECALPDPQVRNRLLQRFAETPGDYRDLETPIVCRDGSLKTIAWSSTAKDYPIPGWASWAIGIDVTDRKKAQRKLAESEARYRHLLETSNHGVWVIDTDHRTVFANHRLGQMLGWPMDELVGKDIGAFHSEDDSELLREMLANGTKAGARVRFSSRFRHKSGQVFWAAVDVSPLYDIDGNLAGHSAILEDISHRKKVERQLRTMHEAYRLLLERTSVPLLRFLPDLTVSWSNFKLGAEPLDHLSRRQLSEALVPLDRWERELRRTFSTGESSSFDAELFGSGGKISTRATLVAEAPEGQGVSSVIAVLDNFALM